MAFLRFSSQLHAFREAVPCASLRFCALFVLANIRSTLPYSALEAANLFRRKQTSERSLHNVRRIAENNILHAYVKIFAKYLPFYTHPQLEGK